MKSSLALIACGQHSSMKQSALERRAALQAQYPKEWRLLHEYDFEVLAYFVPGECQDYDGLYKVPVIQVLRHGVVFDIELRTVNRHMLRVLTRASHPIWNLDIPALVNHNK